MWVEAGVLAATGILVGVGAVVAVVAAAAAAAVVVVVVIAVVAESPEAWIVAAALVA